MTPDELSRIVEEEVRRALGAEAAPPRPPAEAPPADAIPPPAPTPPAAPPLRKAQERGDLAPPSTVAQPRPRRPNVARWFEEVEAERHTISSRHAGATPPSAQSASAAAPSFKIEAPANPGQLARLISSTPSRIGVGRTGVRYLTESYLALRADHAVAKDAVYSETQETLAAQLQCLLLRTCCTDREDFLLYPAHGRRLDDASLAQLTAEGTRGADVQVILADGLSAWAADRNGPELLPLLQSSLASAGFSVGRPLFVRFARVGVQDQIGTVLGNKATLICLGERPGLGTGDSLSIYLAYGPKLDQDNAEKNCISNVRAMGIRAPEAARESVDILKRAFAAGKGGVAL